MNIPEEIKVRKTEREEVLKALGKIEALPRKKRLRAIQAFWLKMSEDNRFQHQEVMKQVKQIKNSEEKNLSMTSKSGNMRHAMRMPAGLMDTIKLFEAGRVDNMFDDAHDVALKRKMAKELKDTFPEYVVAQRW